MKSIVSANLAVWLPETESAGDPGDESLALSFQRSPGRVGVTIIVEACDDPTTGRTELARSVNGEAFTGTGEIRETSVGNGRVNFEVGDTVGVGTAPCRFMRVREQR